MKISEIIGIYGGTFDPVHIGHLRVAIEAKEALNLSRVIWVPTGYPGHRDIPHTSPANRLAMLESVLKDHEYFDLDTTDLLSENITYTVNTLRRLRKFYDPSVSLVLILGMDAFLGLPTWFEWTQLMELAHIAIAARPNYKENQASKELKEMWEKRKTTAGILCQTTHGSMIEFSMTTLDLSASAIREKCQNQSSIEYLVPSSVEAYIQRHPLYYLSQETHEH